MRTLVLRYYTDIYFKVSDTLEVCRNGAAILFRKGLSQGEGPGQAWHLRVDSLS